MKTNISCVYERFRCISDIKKSLRPDAFVIANYAFSDAYMLYVYDTRGEKRVIDFTTEKLISDLN